MLMRSAALALPALVVGLLLAGCGGPGATQQSGSTASIDRAHAQFVQHLDQCTQTVGSDPRSAAVGETELAPGEREWRACAYEGLRTIMMPASTNPDLYAQLITEDQAMTDKVAAGTMTRSARQARLDALRAEIESWEATSTEQQYEHQKMRQVINGLR
jgi:hypothetical protein